MSGLKVYLTNMETIEVSAVMFDMTVGNAQMQGWKLVSNDGYEDSCHADGRNFEEMADCAETHLIDKGDPR